MRDSLSLHGNRDYRISTLHVESQSRQPQNLSSDNLTLMRHIRKARDSNQGRLETSLGHGFEPGFWSRILDGSLPAHG